MITCDEADEILGRFVNSHFNNPKEHARFSIPARPDRDDDLRMAAFIKQTQERERIADELAKALENLIASPTSTVKADAGRAALAKYREGK